MKRNSMFMILVLIITITFAACGQRATSPNEPNPPANGLVAPSNIVLSAAGLTVTVSWSDQSSDEDGYLIERDGGVIVYDLAPDTQSFEDVVTDDHAQYCYVVAVYRGAPTNPTAIARSEMRCINIGSPTGLPDTPTNVAISLNGSTITLTWVDASSNEDGFDVWRNTPSQPTTYSLRQTHPAGTQQHVDVGLANGSWCYYVRAYNANGFSDNSTTICQTVSVGIPTPPAVPTGVATEQVSATSVRVVWIPAAGATSYTVIRNGTVIVTGVTSEEYVSGGLTTGTQYCYVIRAVNADGHADSAQSCITPSATPSLSVPLAPVQFAVSTGPSGTSVTVTAIDASDNEEGFRVYRGATIIATLSPVVGASFSHQVTGMTLGNTYSFRIAAFNGAGEGSTEVVTVTMSVPPANDDTMGWSSGWLGQKSGGTTSLSTFTDGERGSVLRITQGSPLTTQPYQFQLYRASNITTGQTRTFRGWVKTTQNCLLDQEVGQLNSPFHNRGLYVFNDIQANTWTWLSWTYVVSATDTQAKAAFLLGRCGSPVYIDDAFDG